MSILNKFILRKFCAFFGLFAVVFGSGSFVNLSTAEAAGETGIDSAYVDMADPGPVYALFAMDLSEYAAMIPQLAGNFDLLNSSDASCGVASSASLMASFYDISNQFVELEFSTVSCPESTEPARLKFVDPGNPAVFDIVDIQDVSEITPPSGGVGSDWSTDGADDHEIIVNVTFEDWVEYPITVVAWYGTSAEGDPDGAVEIESPGAAYIYVPHVEGETSVMIAAVWWEGGDQNGDPSYVGFYESPVSISGDGPTTVGVTMQQEISGDPELSTVSVSNIAQTSATLSANIVSTGNFTILRRGFRIGVDTGYGNGTISEDNASGHATGVYSLSASSLLCGTTYHVQAFVMTTTYSEYYGADSTFSTSSCGGGGGSVNYTVNVRAGLENDWKDVENASVSVGAYTCNTEDGNSCTISNVPEGTYTISIEADFYDSYSEENVIVNQSSNSYIAYLTPSLVETISGVITDSNSDPLEGVTVFSILFDGDSYPPPPTTTSVTGQFSFSDLEEGAGHGVFAVKDGYVGKYLGPSDLLASNDNTHFDMQLDIATVANSGSIAGTLSAEGAPLSGKKVLAFTADFSGESWPEVLSVGIGESDASGNFTVNGLAPSDSYAVMLLHDFVDYETFGVVMTTVTAGDTTDFDFNVLVPEVTTSSASDVGQLYANLNGFVDNIYEFNTVTYGDNEDALSDAGFEYGILSGGEFTDQSEWADFDSDTGAIRSWIGGLECGTEYQFRAYASTLAGTAYGSTATFETASCGVGGEPVVTTASATNVTSKTAVLNGSVVTNGASINQIGFEYGETLSYGSAGYAYYVSSNVFASNIRDLLCGTTYHYRAYVVSNLGSVYGSDATFSTSACGSAQITVTDGVNPIEGAMVFLDISDYDADFSGSTSAGGTISFTDLPSSINEDDEIVVYVMADGYLNKYVGGLYVNANELTDFDDIVLSSGGYTLSGHVVDMDTDLAISDLEVFLANESGGWGFSQTDASGDYSISGLGQGLYEFEAEGDQYDDYSIFLQVDNNMVHDFELGGGSVSGYVHLDGQNYYDAELAIQVGDFVRYANSDNWDAIYTLGNLPPGTYTLTLTADGYATETEEVVIITDEVVTKNFDIVAAAGNAVDAAEAAGDLVCEFVDSTWNSEDELEFVISASAYNPSAISVSSGYFGNDNSFILIANPTSTAQWTLSVAPTDGAGALWTDGAGNYADFNDADTGTDGSDLDYYGGSLTVDPTDAVIMPYSQEITTTDLSLGVLASFSEGVVDSATLLTAGGSADAPGYWGLKNVSVEQIFPASQAVGTYYLDLTISVI